MAKAYTYRPLGTLHRTLQVFLVLGLIAAAAMAVSAWLQLQLYSQAAITLEEEMANQGREVSVDGLWALILLITVFIFGWWIVRAHRNVRALGAMDLPVSPGWAVGWFFVPIVNLWQPYQAMGQLWRASHEPVRWKSATVNTLVPVWWAVWIITGLASRVETMMSGAATTETALRASSLADVVSSALFATLQIVALLLVRRIAAAQQAAAAVLPPAPPALVAT